MIPPTIEIVSYTSIICMILVYDTPHYDQSKGSVRFLMRRLTFLIYYRLLKKGIYESLVVLTHDPKPLECGVSPCLTGS
jgi:hypothetical protein